MGTKGEKMNRFQHFTAELGHFQISFDVLFLVEIDFKQSNHRLMFNPRDEFTSEDKLHLSKPMGRVMTHSRNMSEIGKPAQIELATIS